jgi:shikimate kinase
MKNKPNLQPLIPNSPKLIFLIGMPAAGKTFWGDKIAKEYALEFIDLDVFVAQHEKASIPALFAQYGENGFREREHKHFKKLTSNITVHTVIACGGGTPCFHENIQLMKDAGVVIYLQADVPQLLENISNSEEIRPLLKGRGDVGAYLEELLQKRKQVYEQAHHILHTKNISLITFDEIINSCINRH